MFWIFPVGLPRPMGFVLRGDMVEPEERPRLLSREPKWWRNGPVVIALVIALVLLLWAAFVIVTR